jgi:hypothetical protein
VKTWDRCKTTCSIEGPRGPPHPVECDRVRTLTSITRIWTSIVVEGKGCYNREVTFKLDSKVLPVVASKAPALPTTPLSAAVFSPNNSRRVPAGKGLLGAYVRGSVRGKQN